MFIYSISGAALWTDSDCHNAGFLFWQTVLMDWSASVLAGMTFVNATLQPGRLRSSQPASKLILQMLSEMLQHPAPRISRRFRIVNFRSRVIEKRMVGVIADNLDR